MKPVVLDMKKFKLAIVFFCFLLLCSVVNSQTKSEKEERIKADAFPEQAKACLKILPKTEKGIKYYKETNDTIISYEAKFKINKKKYSIEFNKNGILEDIEITIDFNNFPEMVRVSIVSYLQTNYDSFEVLKAQKQYKNELGFNSEMILKEALLDKKDEGIFYELVIETHQKSISTYKEITFNDSGTFLFEQTIMRSLSDDIQY